MTGEEAHECVLHALGETRRELEGHGWRLRVFGRAELEAIEQTPIDTEGPDPAAEAEVGTPTGRAAPQAGPAYTGPTYTGNVCGACGKPTRRSAACEVCDHCGTTTGCG